jgi:NADH:ubiquinone oxidoreductase subunit K
MACFGELNLVLRGLKFHHFIVPIAAAMVAIGLALIAAPKSFGVLGPDLFSYW